MTISTKAQNRFNLLTIELNGQSISSTGDDLAKVLKIQISKQAKDPVTGNSSNSSIVFPNQDQQFHGYSKALIDSVTGDNNSAPVSIYQVNSKPVEFNSARWQDTNIQKDARSATLSTPFLDTEYYNVNNLALAPTTSVTGSSSTPSPLFIKGANSNLAFNLTWDASAANAPTAFLSTLQTAFQSLANNFTSKYAVTLNLQIGYGTLNGGALPTGALAASSNYIYSFGTGSAGYQAFRNNLALTSSGSVIDNQTLSKSIPTTSPISSQSRIVFTSGQAKAIGAIAGSSTGIDGYIGFGATNYLQVQGSGYDLAGTLYHEATECMGRIMMQGQSGYYTSEDLMHYSAPNARTVSKGGFLSADGVNKLAYLNAQSTGDAADLASPTSNNQNLGIDSCNAFATNGAYTNFSNNDMFTMDALGWNFASSNPLTTSTNPSYLV